MTAAPSAPLPSLDEIRADVARGDVRPTVADLAAYYGLSQRGSRVAARMCRDAGIVAAPDNRRVILPDTARLLSALADGEPHRVDDLADILAENRWTVWAWMMRSTRSRHVRSARRGRWVITDAGAGALRRYHTIRSTP